MIYQVRANLFFTDSDEASDFYHDCELAYGKAAILNPNSEAVEHSTIELILNHHDQDPNAPCELLGNKTTEL